jgi:hypothetical protein
MELHSKIKHACKDLVKKDNSVREDIETLALEKGRLAYLRDELSRRADAIARREDQIRRNAAPNDLPPCPVRRLKDFDRENAILVELDLRRSGEESNRANMEAVVVVPIDVATSTSKISTPQNEPIFPSSTANLILQQLPGLLIPREFPTPVSEGVGDDVVSSSCSSSSRANPTPAVASSSMQISEDDPMDKAPRPYPQTHTSEQMEFCLNFLWIEYSTDVTEDGSDRLLTLANLIRLSSDADFSISTQSLIDMYLKTVRLAKTTLLEKRYFYAVLLSVLKVSRGIHDKSELDEVLYSEYLAPLMQRVELMQRSTSINHPPLPPFRMY